ncbi:MULTISPECIES: Lrp/AsnC family transcriptional regulator [Sediminimonas]|uniref:Lrp/AsnC family transcriptional regulator n=1 Tax=Sediminimonas qiaohouensis TaxID=552061 RepID=A0A7C9HBL2_9RHOB|nr:MULTISPECIES: Lrp/AsnC family transcriptional regulator [Sediminimonas]MDR9484279.1 Lrp/AsnC family transcriptional regulator [Sediminimonas sp.]MTJ05371.1 Lrp/AsnC family transcriptional regulator [Sediminimonas qiaohouensis]
MVKLDARDMAILRVLSAEGRITKAELAARVGLSASPAWERLKRLEKAGIIEGYSARISLRNLGAHVAVFVAAELEGHTSAHFQAFERAIQDYEEITGCWSLGGGFDYLFHVVTRDIDEYQRLIDALLEARIGLARYYTYIVTKTVKEAGTPPVELLAGLQKN